MRAIRKSGLMSGGRKRETASRPRTAPFLDSTGIVDRLPASSKRDVDAIAVTRRKYLEKNLTPLPSVVHVCVACSRSRIGHLDVSHHAGGQSSLFRIFQDRLQRFAVLLTASCIGTFAKDPILSLLARHNRRHPCRRVCHPFRSRGCVTQANLRPALNKQLE